MLVLTKALNTSPRKSTMLASGLLNTQNEHCFQTVSSKANRLLILFPLFPRFCVKALQNTWQKKKNQLHRTSLTGKKKMDQHSLVK